MRQIAVSLLLIAAMPVKASPVVWTIDNLLFNDGGYATGSFTYDASVNTYSDINISTFNGAGNLFSVYQYVNPGYDSDNELLEMGLNMLNWMWKIGWDEDYGGILYFRDVKGLPVQAGRSA